MMTINPPTASLLLSEFVALEPGEWVIQTAGNSAVGLYVAQLARHRGWRSVSVVRRPDVVEAAREAGADVVLVDGEDLPGRVAEATEGATIRVGFDAVGGSATGRLASCLGQGAVLVNYGRMSGEPCVVGAEAFVFRDLTMRGFWLVNWFRQTSEPERAILYGEIARLIAAGTLYAPIQATYDVSEIKAAVAAADAGERSGKIVVAPRHRTL
jgi:mitochondrial enoyl-[acyl-carrier protein] reductase / trans-2-enoyl-CoA reductase